MTTFMVNGIEMELDEEKREFMEFEETVRPKLPDRDTCAAGARLEPPAFERRCQPNLTIDDLVSRVLGRHAIPELTNEAKEKIHSAFDQLVFGLHALYRATHDLNDVEAANIVHHSMYPAVFGGIRRIRLRYSLPHWSIPKSNEDSATPPAGETGD